MAKPYGPDTSHLPAIWHRMAVRGMLGSARDDMILATEFAMRLIKSVALMIGLAAGSSALSEDLPEGSIGLRVELKEAKIVVAEPIKGGPSDKAGLKPGDVIVKVNDYQAKEKVDQFELERAVREIVKHKPGDKIKLGVNRDGKDMAFEVTVGKRSEIYPKDKN